MLAFWALQKRGLVLRFLERYSPFVTDERLVPPGLYVNINLKRQARRFMV